MRSRLSGRLVTSVRRCADVALLLKVIAVLTAMLTGAMIARAHQMHGPLTNLISTKK
jgi:hypothetical protein